MFSSCRTPSKSFPLRLSGSTISQYSPSSELIAVTFFLALALGRLDANLFVVLLQRGKVLTGFGELALFHAYADIPVHKSALAVHQVELMVDAGEHLCYRRRVADHAASTHDFGQITTWYNGRRLVVDAALEARWRPINELDGAFCFDCGHRRIHILWHHVAAIHHAASHVLAMARVAFHEHGGGLEDGHRDLCNGELFVIRFLCGDNRRVARKHEVDARVRHQIRLELRDIDIQRAIETQRSCKRRDDLAQEAVQVRVRGPLDVQIAPTNIVKRFVVVHDGNVSVLQQGVNTQHCVVWLNDGSGYLRASPDCEAQL